jgi:hypothetical protein
MSNMSPPTVQTTGNAALGKSNISNIHHTIGISTWVELPLCWNQQLASLKAKISVLSDKANTIKLTVNLKYNLPLLMCLHQSFLARKVERSISTHWSTIDRITQILTTILALSRAN